MRYAPEVFAPGYGLLFEKESRPCSTAREAWAQLAKFREGEEDKKPVYITGDFESGEYSETVHILRTLASDEQFYGASDELTASPIAPDGTGEVWGVSPGYAEDEEDVPETCYRVVRGA